MAELCHFCQVRCPYRGVSCAAPLCPGSGRETGRRVPAGHVQSPALALLLAPGGNGTSPAAPRTSLQHCPRLVSQPASLLWTLGRVVSACTWQLRVSGNEVNGSLLFRSFWAVGSSRLEKEQKEKQELSCVCQALGHSSQTAFLEVVFSLPKKKKKRLRVRRWS